jgi:Leucine-rich repeat (LRR) protein
MASLRLSNKNLYHIPDIDSKTTNLLLNDNFITELNLNCFPENIIELDLCDNNIAKIDKDCFVKNIRILYLRLDKNKITEISYIVFPQNLRTLNLSNNKIEDLTHCHFPLHLRKLYMDDNKISKITVGSFPPNLQMLNLDNNLITNLIANCFPQKLKELYMSYCQISEIKHDDFPPNLEILNLKGNPITNLVPNNFPRKLKKLDISCCKIHEIVQGDFPPNLEMLDMSDNYITKLFGGCFPTNLKILNLNNCYIKKLVPHCFPLNLQKLVIYDNYITEIPLWMLDLRRLERFFWSGNPIENIHPLIDRWLDRMYAHALNGDKQVYSDKQNVHNSNIQRSFRSSLVNIMKDKNLITLCECKNYIIENDILSEQIKRELMNYCDDKTKHSVYYITFEDIFQYVISRILRHRDRNEIMKILEEEIKDTICKCFTGRMSRLVNVLNGYYDDISIQIGTNEQISNIILMLQKKYKGEELVSQVRSAMEEREYDEGTIREWLGFL